MWKGSVFSSCFYLFLFLLWNLNRYWEIFTKVFKTWTSQGNALSDSTELPWAPWREKLRAFAQLQKATRGDNCRWWQTPQAAEPQQSPGPEFSCMQRYLGLSPLVVYCQCWVTSPFPLCSISSWISFYVCDALLGSTCLCCFPHFL